MPSKATSTIVGIFTERAPAQNAVAELRDSDFSDDKLALIGRRDEPSEKLQEGPSGPPTFETGAAIGMVTGAALGGLATGTWPAMLAVGLGGALLGALIDLGIPETDARFFQDEAKAGRYVVTVGAENRAQEAISILEKHGAQRVRRVS